MQLATYGNALHRTYGWGGVAGNRQRRHPVSHTVEHVAPADGHVAELTAFQPRNNHFIGIDSDGCVFDAMEIKHKECFIPATIKCWRPVSYTHLRAHETVLDLVCRLLLETKQT